MQRSDFFYELPDELIARFPATERSGSRLLCLDGQSGDVQHRQFIDIVDILKAGDLLVLNDTRVLAARLFGQKVSGGKIEVLVERVLDKHCVLAQIRASKALKAGSRLSIYKDQHREGETLELAVLGRQEQFYELQFPGSALDALKKFGHMPLPPYIDRADELADQSRYQTVYAQHEGAVAAPTAGLHFDAALMTALQEKGVEMAYVTLHVGAGTFQPVRVDDIESHKMHSEYLDVSATVCQQVASARQRGGRVVAVGTTSVRCLETASASGEIQPYQGDTDIFIYPGYRFRCVDALITNFHLPESTLIMLVSAFAGQENVLNAYAHAVAQRYRFFSYGDAMFVQPAQGRRE